MGELRGFRFQAEGDKRAKHGVRMLKRSILAAGTDRFHIVAPPVAPRVFDSTATIDREITPLGSR